MSPEIYHLEISDYIALIDIGFHPSYEFWANHKVFIPVHMILLDAVYKSQSMYVHEDPKPKQKTN